MTNTFIDIPILLEHRSQVAKGIFIGYHLTIESNILLLMRSSTEITLHVLCFRPTKPKIFCLQSSSPQFKLLVNPARRHHLASPTIKPRWYGRSEGASYAIVQHSSSCVRAVTVGAVCSCSGATVPTGPADTSEGGIRAVKNYVAEGNWTKDLSSGTILDGTS
jgi:hypothetical protein